MINAADGQHQATDLKIHPSYDEPRNNNDISMIEVDLFKDPATPINYNTPEEVEEGTELKLFGYGRIDVSLSKKWRFDLYNI